MKFKSLFKGYGINHGFTMRVPSLVSLRAYVVFNDSIRMEHYHYWTSYSVNETCKVGGVQTQKQLELGRANASYAILNQPISLLTSYLYYSFYNVSNVFTKPI